MSWAMAAVSGIAGGMAKGLQTGYQDSANNNAVGSAIPQRMQNFMGVGMQRLNDKIMADRQTQAQRAAANAGNASGNSITGAVAGVGGVGIMGGTNKGYARSTGGSQYMPGMGQRTAIGVGMNGSRGFTRRQEAQPTPEKVYETQEFAGSDFQSQAGYATPPPPGFERNMTPEHAAKRAMGIARGWDREKAASVGAII